MGAFPVFSFFSQNFQCFFASPWSIFKHINKLNPLTSFFQLFFLLVILIFIHSCCVLILLILRNKIIHIWFSFGELHFIHALTCVPMKEGFSPEKSRKLHSNHLKTILNCRRVPQNCGGKLESLRWYITDRRFYIIWNPFNEVWRIFGLDVKNLLINLLGRHSTSEHDGCCEISPVSWVWSAHHIFSIEHLLGELWYGKCSILLRPPWSQRGEASHEKVKPRERDEIRS